MWLKSLVGLSEQGLVKRLPRIRWSEFSYCINGCLSTGVSYLFSVVSDYSISSRNLLSWSELSRDLCKVGILPPDDSRVGNISPALSTF